MSRHFTNLRGEVVGTYRGIEPTGECDGTGSARWLFRCACERVRYISARELKRYQREGKQPRCYCPEYSALLAQSGIVHARRCGLCKSVEHPIAQCPKRKAARWCGTCAGLAHRVRGIKCRECGLRFAKEPPVELTAPSGSSPAARCLEFALGGDSDDHNYRRPKKARAA